VVPNAAITIKHFLEYASQTEPISLKKCKIHPVVSTMMPKRNAQLKRFINDWMHVKNEICDGDAGLQLSINSTNEDERAVMFSGNACGIEDIARIMYDIVPRGRKITLNFAVADYDVNPGLLANLFNPEHYIIKLTPMHKTKKAIESGTKTSGDYTTYYPYQELEKRFLDVGYDVIVFIASAEEDESRITCGNAILSDKVGIGVRCRTCFRTKKPIGRSAPMEAANGYCDTDCPGYVEHPHPGYLWPDETQEEFGY
jgi:23S rRNA (adenine2503-C2)-methyltransferase